MLHAPCSIIHSFIHYEHKVNVFLMFSASSLKTTLLIDIPWIEAINVQVHDSKVF